MKINEKSLPHEIFEEVQNAKKKADRVAILKNYSSFATKTILQLNFNDKVKLDLPDGKPPYRDDEAPAGLQVAPINKQVKLLGRLTPNSNIPKIKKEQLFIRCLEGIHNKDAAILCAAKDGELTKLYSKVTLALVKETHPKLVQ